MGKHLRLSLATICLLAARAAAEVYSYDFSAQGAAGDFVTTSMFAIGDRILLAGPDGVSFSLEIISAPPPGIAGPSFIAKGTAADVGAIVKPGGGGLRITIDDSAGNRIYTFRIKDGRKTFAVREKSTEPDECATCAAGVEAPTTAAAPSRSPRLRAGAAAESDAFQLAEHKAVVDVLVAFDKGAREWAESDKWPGGDSIEEFADYAISKMNFVLEKSQLLDKFSYRLVGVVKVDATYDVIDNKLLNDLRLRNSGALAPVGAARERCGADTISLLIDRDRDKSTTSGLGYEYLSNSWSYASFDAIGYTCNVCDIKTVYERYTISHETGHNMGCGHSNRQGANSGPGCHPYSCGYHFQDNAGTNHYTIMAYENTSPASGTYYPVPYFSSPDITPEELGVPVGTPTNNNRLTIINNYKGVAAWREHVVPYDWDVRFLDSDGNDIPDGTYFSPSLYVTLSHENPNARVYYTYSSSAPTEQSPYCSPGTRFTFNGTRTITACAVVDGVAQSVRTVTFNEGLSWSGQSGLSGNGIWKDGDSSVLSWNNSTSYFYSYMDAVLFPDLAQNYSPTATVYGTVVPTSAAFLATYTAYTFAKGDNAALISLRDAAFAPSGDLAFNVPVNLGATSFTSPAAHTVSFNAPFGTNVAADATYGHCTNMVVVGSGGTLVVAPGENKTQAFDRFNNTGTYWSDATFRVGTGTVRFKGPINGKRGLFGSTKIAVGNGGNLVFEVGGPTGYGVNNSSITIDKGGAVTFNQMEHMRRSLHLNGGTIYAKRLDLMSNPGIHVGDDSSMEDMGGGYLQIRGADATIDVSDGKTLALNLGTQVRDTNDANGRGIVKTGGGEIVANVLLKHSGQTVVSNGTFTVGYSSATAYGTGWMVKSGATLKLKGGCALAVPALSLESGATLAMPAAETAPLSSAAAVDISGARLALVGAYDVSAGKSYPILSSAGGIAGVADVVTDDLPALADKLKWTVEEDGGTLFAKVVERDPRETVLKLVANNPGLTLSLPADAALAPDGKGVTIADAPISINGFSTNVVAITVDVVIPDGDSGNEATLVSWKVGSAVVRCVRNASGNVDCFYGVSDHVANSASSMKLEPGRHLIAIGYYSYANDTCGGTYVYVDGTLAYRAPRLRWSSANIGAIAIGATAFDPPTLPYGGLVVKGVAVLDATTRNSLPNMTSSGGSMAYRYMAKDYPCVFGLPPAGSFLMDEALVYAEFDSLEDRIAVSVVAAFPTDAAGTVLGLPLISNGLSGIQAEYEGDGTFAIRWNGYSLATYPATVVNQCVADVDKPHLYTLTFSKTAGAMFFQDGVKLLSATVGYEGESVNGKVMFGCGPWTSWISSYNDNPMPMPDFKVYASHVALGTDDRMASESAAMESLNFDSAYDGLGVAEKLSYLPECQTATGVEPPPKRPYFIFTLH